MSTLDDILGTANEPAATVKEANEVTTINVPEDVQQDMQTDASDKIAQVASAEVATLTNIGVAYEKQAELAASKDEENKTLPAQVESAEVADAILDKLLARMSPVGDAVPYRKMLLFGQFGVGKTVFLGSAPKPLIVAVEPTGPLSLQNHPDLAANVTVFQFVSVHQLEVLLDKIIEIGTAHGPAKVHELFGETFCIDSFSELQKWDLDDVVRKAAANDASRNKFLPTGPDYNINTEHMRQIGSKLEQIPMHVIVTCHVKEEKDDATGRILKRPNLTPKLAGTLAGKFDVVAYMDMNDDGESSTRTLQCHPTNTVMAKTRIGGLPRVLENPTFDALFANAKSN